MRTEASGVGVGADQKQYRWIGYETVDDGTIAVISLNRPHVKNAQHRGLLVELDDAFLTAEADDAVRVVVLRAEGSSFSAGHDLGTPEAVEEREPGADQHPSFTIRGGTKDGIEQNWTQEWHYYFENTRRWRELRKITVASVQGPVVSAGLMLMWACDLIVADTTAVFADVVATRMGMAGVEYFAHPWEFGPRRAKELLLTGDSLSAAEAHSIGMVSRVFPEGRLQEETMAFARRIAAVPTAASVMVKDAVNQAQNQQGFQNALQGAFSLHSLNHAHWAIVNGSGAALTELPDHSKTPRGPMQNRPFDRA